MRLLRIPAAIALSLLAAGCNAGAPTTPAASPGALPAAPPWPAPADPSARIHAAGLEPLVAEGTLVHYHAHLDVFYNGQAVQVPALIGIDNAAGRISALHTHIDSGVLHVESPKAQTITLGQFFTEWNVPLTGASVYLDGQPVADGANLSLADHQQIAVVFGTPPAQIPNNYTGGWF